MTREEERIMIPKKIKKIYLNNVDENVSDMQNREYIDLSQVWHDASEEPKCDEYLLGEDNGGFSIYVWCRQEDSWNLFVGITTLCRWAYISDLLPKQFENS